MLTSWGGIVTFGGKLPTGETLSLFGSIFISGWPNLVGSNQMDMVRTGYPHYPQSGLAEQNAWHAICLWYRGTRPCPDSLAFPCFLSHSANTFHLITIHLYLSRSLLSRWTGHRTRFHKIFYSPERFSTLPWILILGGDRGAGKKIVVDNCCEALLVSLPCIGWNTACCSCWIFCSV